MDHHSWRRLVSEQRTGVVAGILRSCLRSASLGYSAIIGVRNSLYSAGGLKTHFAAVPVISVGNITAGGTGKTPLVIWVCRQIISDQISGSDCAILTRGYKASQGRTRDTRYEIRDTFRDEPAMLAESCPGVAVVVNPDRVDGAAEAVRKFGAKLLIMDDGFQHRRLGRDLDIVAIDAMQPFGYGRILPAGLLREPVSSLTRAHAVVITRCDQVGEEQLARLEQKLRSVNPALVIARSIHAPLCAKTTDNRQIGLEELKSRKVFAFCGIGNPEGFFGTIRGLGGELVGSKVYDDHYHYTQDDMAEIYALAESSKADFVLTTQKDWTKTAHTDSAGQVLLAYLAVELKFTAGKDKLKQLIEDTLAGKISGK